MNHNIFAQQNFYKQKSASPIMQEIHIDYDNKKRIRQIFFGILLICVSLAFLYYMIFLSRRISIYYFVAFSLLACYMTYVIILAIKEILKKDKIGLILDAEGIHYKSLRVKKIKWSDINSIYAKKQHGTNFVFLQLSDPELYLEKLPKQVKQNMINNGVGINCLDLKINFNEMHSLIEKYFTHYKKN